MTVKEPLILYSRADCHLCKLAEAMLGSADLAWREVDIDDDLELLGKYGVRVPVICRPDDGKELFFPFDEEALLRFTAGP